jgi:hypothetical protein
MALKQKVQENGQKHFQRDKVLNNFINHRNRLRRISFWNKIICMSGNLKAISDKKTMLKPQSFLVFDTKYSKNIKSNN